MDKLSERAWRESLDVIDAIKEHPFNQELMKGSLSMDKFEYYIEQDKLYLRDFARAHAMIASRVSQEYMRDFLIFSEGCFVAEQEVVHTFFESKFTLTETGGRTPALIGYTNYLLRMCAVESVELGIAAVLPCFWVYMEIGLFMKKFTIEDNKYRRWIETYSGESFQKSVYRAIEIFDEVGLRATEETQRKMVKAFYDSTVFEWHFWNDAYIKSHF